MTDIEQIRTLCIAARRGDNSAFTQLRTIGQQTANKGGADAMCDLFWRLHDYQIDTYGSACGGSSGGSPAEILSAAWDAIPAWANL